jgi:iron(III) transport system substrate-binding protein
MQKQSLTAMALAVALPLGLSLGLPLALFGGAAFADAGELNLYSSRHYDTDERLYSDFEEQTGIKINRIEAKGDELIERMKSEGDNSPADVFITVDAGRLWRADEAGLFQPVESEVLMERIPEHLRHPDGHWFGFSKRARIIFYDKDRVAEGEIERYQDLTDPKFEGMVCTRSSGNIYMLSLMASMIDHIGPGEAEEWAKGVWVNRARDPEGGDTDQLRAIASGECAIAISNTYYFSRALRKEVKGLDDDALARIGWVFPNQDSFGSHVNISGAGVAKHAKNKENAVKFLEYLSGKRAQEYFSAGNDEYPVVAGTALSESVAKLGDFKEDTINLDILGKNQADAQKVYDRVGYK